MADEEVKNEEGSGQGSAPGETDEGKSDKDTKSDQSSTDTSKDGGEQKSDHDFPTQEAAEKSYRNLMKMRTADRQKIREQDEELKRLRGQASDDDDGDDDTRRVRDEDIDSVVDRRLAVRERERNMRSFFVSNPDVRKDAELLAEMENVLDEQPELKGLSDPLTVARDVAEARLGRTRAAASQSEREKAERKERTDSAKRRSGGHRHGASRREYESGDRIEDTREMTPEERDAYVREHQFDE